METTTFNLTAAYGITQAEVAKYQKDGHILFRGVLSPDEIEYFRPLPRQQARLFYEERCHEFE